MRNVLIVGALLATCACESTGQVGLMTKPGSNPGALLTQSARYETLGQARGEACRYFLLAIIPWGDSTPSTAFNRAIAQSGGDALINTSVTSSLYGFIPIYNIFSWTCTSVEGTAIRFVSEPATPQSGGDPMAPDVPAPANATVPSS